MTKELIRNSVFKPIYNTDKRFIRLQGGAGSGKSIAIAQFLLITCMSVTPHRIFAFRKIGRTVKDSIFATFKDLIYELGLSEVFKLNRSTHTAECLIPPYNTIIMGGMDDPEKVKSIKDPTIIWMEEATEFNRKDFQQLNLRLRKAGVQNHLILSYNPISTASWIYQDFVLDSQFAGRELFINTTYKDNPFLPEEYTKELERLSLVDKNYHKIYTLGEWGEGYKGIIFPSVEVVEEFPDASTVYGLDFGYNDSMALVKVAIGIHNLYVDCLFYETGKTINQLAEFCKDAGIERNDLIYCDSASPGDIQVLYNAGFKGAKPSIKGKDSIRAGIRKIQEYNLHVTSRSTDLLKELSRYKWDEDKEGELMERPIDAFNHAIDAMRYAVYTHTYKPQRQFNLT